MRISKRDPISQELMVVVHAGGVEQLRVLLGQHPNLASAHFVDDKGSSETPLHVATVWPGFFPRGREVIEVLLEAGSDPNARVEGSWHSETPLHWAASTDDVEVARALVDGSADIEATGASIARGSPLDNAVGYGCWQVARLLVERGARVDRLWHAAALGMMRRADELMAAAPPNHQELTDAFWQACHGGQLRMAQYLMALGADINGTPSWGAENPLDVADVIDTGREALVGWLRTQGAEKSAKTTT